MKSLATPLRNLMSSTSTAQPSRAASNTKKKSSPTSVRSSTSLLPRSSTFRSESLLIPYDEASFASVIPYAQQMTTWSLKSKIGRQLAKYASLLGIQWSVGNWPDFNQGRFEVNNYADLAHEISHWIFSAPSRRSLKHFGLGAPGSYGQEGRVSEAQAFAEEVMASLLGISMVYTLGDEDGARSLFCGHNWVDNLTQSAWAYAILRDHGFVTYDCEPKKGECLIPLATFRPVVKDQRIHAAVELTRKHPRF